MLFQELNAHAHSVILASGTLSPLDGLETSLESFPHRLEASHVIDAKRQVRVAAIGSLGTGRQLLGTFQHAHQWSYQDALGDAIVSHLPVIPAGVLCFVPSFSFLSKLVERWKSTGCWKDESYESLSC